MDDGRRDCRERVVVTKLDFLNEALPPDETILVLIARDDCG
jgi:hypothetical protein